jgi:cytochrome P450
MMAAGDDGDQWGEDELIHNVIGVFMAGHEATGFVLARSVLRLLDTPGSYQRLVEQPELIPSAVEELLRVEAPSDTALLRVATEDVELPSGTVRKGEAVLVSIGGANHDPAVYDQPHELRLDRVGPQTLSFGRGAHFCLGFRLAKVELEESLAVLTERFPKLTLAVPREELPWSQGAFKFLASLPVTAG